MNTEQTHTPEPWTTGEATEASNFGGWQARIRAKDSNGNVTVAKVMSGNGKEHDTKEVAEANARRIVACVNACAGISTETLKHTKFEGNWQAGQQRDELAEALRTIRDITSPGLAAASAHLRKSPQDRISDIYGMARAALAKVQS